jgi:O-antigen ligase/tetratricopeptide (TPR) repeat protein
LPLLVVLVACAFSLLDTVHWRASLHELLRLLIVFSFFWLTIQLCANVQRAVGLLTAIVLGGTWAAIQGIIEQKTNPDLAWRPFSFFLTQNLFAGELMLALPLSVGLLIYLRSWAQRTLRDSPYHLVALIVCDVLPLLASLLILYALGLTGSRGGWLAFFVAASVGFIAWLRSASQVKSSQRRWMGLAMVGVLVGVAFVALPLRVRLLEMAQGEQMNSWMFRWFTWKGAATMAATHPFNGTGIGTFEFIYPRAAETGFTRTAHQAYLQFAAETGVIGGIAFLLFIASVLVLTWKRWRTAPAEQHPLVLALLVAVTGFAVHNFVDYSWNTTTIALTFLACVAVINNQCPMTNVQWKLPRMGHGSRVTGHGSLRQRRLAFALLLIFCLLMNFTLQRQVAAETSRKDSEARLRMGNAATAKAAAQRAVSLDRSAVENHLQLAHCHAFEHINLQNKSAQKAAVAAYERAISLVPTDSRPYKRLAEFWRKVGDLPKERDALTRALRQNPHEVEMLVHLGKAEFDLKNFIAARTAFLRAVNLARAPYGKYPALGEVVDVNYARAYLYLSKLEFQMKRWDDAVNWLNAGLNVTQRALDKERQTWSQLRSLGVPVPREAAALSEIKELRGQLSAHLVEAYNQLGDKEKADEVAKRAEEERQDND